MRTICLCEFFFFFFFFFFLSRGLGCLPAPKYSVVRGHIFPKSHSCLSGHNFGSIKDTDLINTAIDRYLIDLSKKVR